MKHHVLVLNGPDLNLLGSREPATLAEVEAGLHVLGARLGVGVFCLQSNYEGALIDRVHAARGEASAIIINPGGLTHTSVALRDALAAVAIPFVEVHVSNVHAREGFRHHSFLSPIARATLVGCGVAGYGLALRFLVESGITAVAVPAPGLVSRRHQVAAALQAQGPQRPPPTAC